MYKSIFVTYNRDSLIGQNTALRLQTISNLYGHTVYLPARHINQFDGVNEETKKRISQSSVIVAFGLEDLTLTMQAELQYATTLNKPIIAIYYKELGHTMDFKGYKNKQEIFIDYYDTESALHQIAKFLGALPESKTSKNEIGATEAIIGIGLGLLALWALSKVKS
ncbi:MAG: hypothetical protein SFU99_02425 [Saprospiraceae bacterium]|nr:hypothetical protein [Saprospiraceae bacterium]